MLTWCLVVEGGGGGGWLRKNTPVTRNLPHIRHRTFAFAVTLLRYTDTVTTSQIPPHVRPWWPANNRTPGNAVHD